MSEFWQKFRLRLRCWWFHICPKHGTEKSFYPAGRADCVIVCDECETENRNWYERQVETTKAAIAKARAK